MVASMRRTVAVVFDLDVASGVGKAGDERVEIAQVRSDADGGEAGAGRFDAGDQGQQVVDRMGGPGVGVGAGVAGDFGPGAEVQRQEFAPGVEGLEVVVGEAGMIKGAGEVEAEVVGGAEARRREWFRARWRACGAARPAGGLWE